jgi:hypothetical protein
MHWGKIDDDPEALGFLGVVGVMGHFSKNARDMRRAYAVATQRREQLPGILVLDRAKAIAAERIKQMDELLARFEADSFGYF